MLASLCAPLSDYLKVGQIRVCLCFILLFSTEIANTSLFALARLSLLKLRVTEMGPHNYRPSLHLSGVRIHPATGTLIYLVCR